MNRVAKARGGLYYKIGHLRQLFLRSYRRWMRKIRSKVLFILDLIEEQDVRHPGLPDDLRGLSGRTLWVVRIPLIRNAIRTSGIEQQIFDPFLAFAESARRLESESFRANLEILFQQYEELAEKTIRTNPESALSNYRFLSSRGLSYSSRMLRETGLRLLAEEVDFGEDPARALLLRIGMGDYSGARRLHVSTARKQESTSFEHLAISQLLANESTVDFERKFLDPYLLSLVEGRKISIVGPSNGSAPDSCSIPPENLILRFEEARRPPQFQRRTNIGWEDSNPSRKEPKFIGNQSVLLVNYPEFMNRFNGSLPPIVRQERFEGLGGYGLPLGAMRAILNLLPYGPSELYVSGIDFFLSESNYEQGYGGLDQADELFHHWSLMHGHDLLANLNLGKALFAKGKVKGDAAFVRAVSTPLQAAAKTYDITFWRRLYSRLSRNC